MNVKSTQKKPSAQQRHPIAGIFPGDFNTEFIGCRKTLRVHTWCNGRRIAFRDQDPTLKAMLYQRLLNDTKAMDALQYMDYDDALERFVYCLWGGADGMPDISEIGAIGPADNFNCGIDGCTCSTWASKKIKMNGSALTPREVETMQRLASDDPDKQIADDMGISTHTLTRHKVNLYAKANVMSRAGLITAGYQLNILQP